MFCICFLFEVGVSPFSTLNTLSVYNIHMHFVQSHFRWNKKQVQTTEFASSAKKYTRRFYYRMEQHTPLLCLFDAESCTHKFKNISKKIWKYHQVCNKKYTNRSSSL